MKTLAITAVGLLWVASLSVVVNAADQTATEPAAQTNAPDMATMQTMMQAMQAQMAAIRAEKNPAKRAELMNQHMTSMHAAMQALQQNGGCMMGGMSKMGGGKMMNGMGTANGMNMMQQMMEQMRQHQEAMQNPAP